MINCIDLGFTGFRVNLKRGTFLLFVLFISMIVGVITYRKGMTPELLTQLVVHPEKFIGYYLIFLSAEMFSKEFQNGFYKNIYTSGMSKSSIIIYKTFSVLFTAIFLFLMILMLHIVVAGVVKTSVNIKLIENCFVTFLLAGLHYSSVATLLIACLNKYKATMIFMFVCYIVLPYIYICYRSLTGYEPQFLYNIPCLALDFSMYGVELRVSSIFIIIFVSLAFYIGGIIIAKNKEIHAFEDNK